jgi:ABC-type polysaccharide/polyol phosphate transport system ATPase subunit
MALDRNILLVDEVLAVGDESFRRKSLAMMCELPIKAGTIILVSHALPNVAEFCDRVMWLEYGKVKLAGEAGAVVKACQAEVARATQKRPRYRVRGG